MTVDRDEIRQGDEVQLTADCLLQLRDAAPGVFAEICQSRQTRARVVAVEGSTVVLEFSGFPDEPLRLVCPNGNLLDYLRPLAAGAGSSDSSREASGLASFLEGVEEDQRLDVSRWLIQQILEYKRSVIAQDLQRIPDIAAGSPDPRGDWEESGSSGFRPVRVELADWEEQAYVAALDQIRRFLRGEAGSGHPEVSD